ncbi:MAG: 4-(cytidine 5'-diphospho)-2-C-methyl-D-erythritol kinase [Clostridiales bacterium]|nr:4-(cytidine 5'-diphospho)-2-C-methyl-D-erythritol kinase [Clostridiales bacterium]
MNTEMLYDRKNEAVNVVRLRAPAKINLGLDVTGRRENGYHEVSMIMQSLELCDEIELIRTEDGRISLTIEDLRGRGSTEIPSDDSNLMCRAASIMRDRFALGENALDPGGRKAEFGVSMKLKKRIPSEAGMGGGSADAAAVFLGINSLFSLGISETELMEEGARLGADIPFCIMGGTARAEGIGEKLTPIRAAISEYVLVIKPVQGMSTPEVYRAYDREADAGRVIVHPDIDGLERALIAGNMQDISSCMGNVLEHAVIPQVPVIGRIKEELSALGAESCMMTGSGSAVFGLFSDQESMHRAAQSFGNVPYISELSDIIETRFLLR